MPHLEASSLEFDSIEDTLASFKSGNFIIVLDSPSRENEGDLIVAASALTTSKASFMIQHTSGLLCTPLPSTRADELGIPPMVPPAANTEFHRTAFTVSIDANRPEISTGISAHDRALTCRLLADGKSSGADFLRPGHILPLRARPGGVRERNGHTEAAVEFCKLAGLPEAAVICELVEAGLEVEGVPERPGSGMMRAEECQRFAKRWGLKVCTIEALIEYLENGSEKGKEINGH
ncbi:MAG: hypothetical protein M1814_005700 [Vezdaea aestivalis]|nr:MAG: hypothetical protein M1814_005700 [Vezdaea aestivalis]